MDSRVIEIYQSTPMSLEAIYYLPKQRIVLTVTKELLDKSNDNTSTYGLAVLIDQKKNSLLNNHKILNLMAKDEAELKDFKSRLHKNCECLYNLAGNIKINNARFKYDDEVSYPKCSKVTSYNKPNIGVLMRAPATAHVLNESKKSSTQSKEFGRHYYKRDVDNGLLENFIKREQPHLSTYLLSAGIFVGTLGVIAVKSGLVDSVANKFSPS